MFYRFIFTAWYMLCVLAALALTLLPWLIVGCFWQYMPRWVNSGFITLELVWYVTVYHKVVDILNYAFGGLYDIIEEE